MKILAAVMLSSLILGDDLPSASLATLQTPVPTARTLEVPANSAWQHAETELILPPRLADLRRTWIRDLGQDELDIVAEYRGDNGMVATVYLFKSGLPDPSIWFDRALFMLQARAAGRSGTAVPAATPFTPAGRTGGGGLLTALDVGGGGTALAVVPAAPRFLLKVRISAAGSNAARVRADLTRLLGEVRWPAWARDPGASAVVIQPCARPLRTARAREVRGDPMSGLLNAMGSALPRPLPAGGSYCREPGATVVRGVYRLNADTTGYVIALADSGLALSAGATLTIGGPQDGQPRGSHVSLIFHDREGTALLPTYDRLPPPDQALQALGSGRPTMRIEAR